MLCRSAVFGILWYYSMENKLILRHACDESDPSIKYSWLRHDASTFGEQKIIDTGGDCRDALYIFSFLSHIIVAVCTCVYVQV